MQSMIDFLVSQGLFDRVVHLAGGRMWTRGLRGSCSAARRIVPAPDRYGDENDMLVGAAGAGDVGTCLFAISLGANRFFRAAEVAALNGRPATFKLLQPRCECGRSLYLQALYGGDMEIMRLTELQINDRYLVAQAVCGLQYYTRMILPAHMAGVNHLMQMIKGGPDAGTLTVLCQLRMYIAGLTGNEQDTKSAFDLFAQQGAQERELFRFNDYYLRGAAAAGSMERVELAIKLGAKDMSCVADSAIITDNLPMLTYALESGAELCIKECIKIAAIHGRLRIMEVLEEYSKTHRESVMPSTVVNFYTFCDLLSCAAFAFEHSIEVTEYLVKVHKCDWNDVLGAAAGAGNYALCLHAIRNGANNFSNMLIGGYDEQSASICKLAIKLGADSSILSYCIPCTDSMIANTSRFHSNPFMYENIDYLRKVAAFTIPLPEEIFLKRTKMQER